MTETHAATGNGRKPYLLLFASALFSVLAVGQWSAPAAAWIAPALMLLFLRQQKPVKGLLAGFAVYFVALSIALRGVILIPSIVVFLAMIGFVSFVSFIPFAADRLIGARYEGFLSTLVFPMANTVMEYFSSFSPSSGSFGSLANTQLPGLPLIQLASITGIWGISFLVTWFCSIAVWIWSKDFSWERIRRGVCIYAGILAAVLLFGGLRLSLYQPGGKPVMIAGVTSQYVIKPLFMKWLETGACPPLERSLGELRDKTGRATRTGARIVVWGEYTALIAKKDVEEYVRAGQELARAHGIYLLLSAGVMGDSKKIESDNMAVFIDPAGAVLWRYSKHYLVPGAESFYMVPGKKEIPVVTTPYGKIAAVICFDLDFPSYVRTASAQGADIILVPSYDWREISPIHTYMAGFRAIENGFTVVRVTGNGYTAALDTTGRVIAGMDFFTSGTFIMSAEVPTRRSFTPYSLAGDWFAWLCIAAFVPVVVVMEKKGRRSA